MEKKVQFLESPLLKAAGVQHGWFMRYGGVSSGLFRSLNGKKGGGDTDEHVDENRHRATAALGLDYENLAYISNAFKTDILEATRAGRYVDFDAALTTTPQLVLAQSTADCASILMSSEDTAALVLVHGSWHTLSGGIITKAVQKLQAITKAPLIAAVGPMICARCYEFGPEAESLFGPLYRTKLPEGKFLVNLPKLVDDQLHQAGVRSVDSLHICTKEDERFFSHRRDGAASERMLTMAALPDVI